MEKLLNLAPAGSIDFASASDMVLNAMSALGMGVDEAGTIAIIVLKMESVLDIELAT